MIAVMTRLQKGDEVIADIMRGDQRLTLPGIVKATNCGDVLVEFPSRLVPIRGRELGQRNHKWIPDWEWLPEDRVYIDPYSKGW